MNSYLFGSGIVKFVKSSIEYNVNYSMIESIQIGARGIEHESIINAVRNWEDVADYDHVEITLLIRLHKHTTSTLSQFKALYAFNKTEVDAFRPSQTADAFVDKDGQLVKFRFEIVEIFPLETPFAYDTMRVIFKSKKPVNLSGLQVAAAGGSVPMDTDGSVPMDTDGSVPTD